MPAFPPRGAYRRGRRPPLRIGFVLRGVEGVPGLEGPALPAFKTGSLSALGRADAARAGLGWAGLRLAARWTVPAQGDRFLSARGRGARSREGGPQGGWVRAGASGQNHGVWMQVRPQRRGDLVVAQGPRLSTGNNAELAQSTCELQGRTALSSCGGAWDLWCPLSVSMFCSSSV